MAAKTTLFDGNLLKLIFNGTTIANLAINATSSPITNIYVSLHTASPGVGGTQTTNEAAYPSYARVAVARTSGGWTITSASVSPVANISFPVSTGSPSETHTYFGVGSASTGTGSLYYFGPITPSITMNAPGIEPVLTSASTITES